MFSDSKTVGITVGLGAAAFLGYCIYFDHKRRSAPDFKDKLKVKSVSQELNHFCHLLHDFSQGVKTHLFEANKISSIYIWWKVCIIEIHVIYKIKRIDIKFSKKMQILPHFLLFLLQKVFEQRYLRSTSINLLKFRFYRKGHKNLTLPSS